MMKKILGLPTLNVCIYTTTFLISFATAGIVQAVPFTPDSESFVVAQWPTKPLEQRKGKTNTLDDIEWLLAQGKYAGKGHNSFARAKALLTPYLSKHKHSNKAKIWYMQARILQYQHQFVPALSALEKAESALKQSAYSTVEIVTNISLLKANIYIALAQYDKAKRACVELLGKTDLLTTTACSLEVESYQNKLSDSYQQLSTWVNKYGLPSHDVGLWIAQILADMAFRQHDYTAAHNWLADVRLSQPLSAMPLSFIVQWADVQLSLNQAVLLTHELSAVVNSAEFQDDALLLRLALAEQHISSGKSVNQTLFWRHQLAERMQLREWRNDDVHAAELAYYFIDIAPQPTKALHWATINWQQAKLPVDAELLKRAQQMQLPKKDKLITERADD